MRVPNFEPIQSHVPCQVRTAADCCVLHLHRRRRRWRPQLRLRGLEAAKDLAAAKSTEEPCEQPCEALAAAIRAISVKLSFGVLLRACCHENYGSTALSGFADWPEGFLRAVVRVHVCVWPGARPSTRSFLAPDRPQWQRPKTCLNPLPPPSLATSILEAAALHHRLDLCAACSSRSLRE